MSEIRKGDKVRINSEKYLLSMEKTISLEKRTLPKDHPYIKDTIKRLKLIQSRAEREDIATVMFISDKGSENEYLNLKFEDGFECGISSKIVNKV